jgi:exonuclease III
MKIATFNVNGIRSRLSNLIEWLDREKPDIVCLQELKAADDVFPALAIEGAGYKAIWNGQKSWNGVAILPQPIYRSHRERHFDWLFIFAQWKSAARSKIRLQVGLVRTIYPPRCNSLQQ